MLFLVSVAVAVAQTITVKGTVVDAADEPLPGVSVQVVGSNQGTMTDYDGNYQIAGVKGDATLRFSFVGTKTVEEKINNRTSINVKLLDDNQNLDEVVVIGYGAAKAKDLTAPIAVIKGSEITNIPTSSPMAALQGKVPGVNILNSGTPGDGLKSVSAVQALSRAPSPSMLSTVCSMTTSTSSTTTISRKCQSSKTLLPQPSTV